MTPDPIPKGIVGERFYHAEVIEAGLSVKDAGKHGCFRRAVKIHCDCGVEKIVRLDWWIRAKHSSCIPGCPFTHRRKREPRLSSAHVIFRKGYGDGDLTIEQFITLSQKCCFYCNSFPSNQFNVFEEKKRLGRNPSEFSLTNGLFIYNGLDRIDSLGLHDYTNVVPCCFMCNWIKLDRSIIEFANWIIRVNQFWKIPFTNGSREFPNTQYLLDTAKIFGFEIPSKPIPNADSNPNRYGSLVIVSEYIKNDKRWADCICDCGEKWSGLLGSLKSGATKSCGGKCPFASFRKQHPILTSANAIFVKRYNDGDLSIEQFFLLSQLDCWYCGLNSQISNRHNHHRKPYGEYVGKFGTFHYNGLDRIDSNGRHSLDNVVPSCSICNTSKKNFTVDEFSNWLDKVLPWATNYIDNNYKVSKHEKDISHQCSPQRDEWQHGKNS